MNLSKEFWTVDRILHSHAKTRGVDAFALALIKSEKQMRRLVTHLAYQSPAFIKADIGALEEALVSNRQVYFDGLERGFNAVSYKSVESLMGAHYQRLRKRLRSAKAYRDKIFHGQLTGDHLSRPSLTSLVCDIRLWCQTLGEGCWSEFRYDGFSSSFRKSESLNLIQKLQLTFQSIKDYEDFVRRYMAQPRKPSECGFK